MWGWFKNLLGLGPRVPRISALEAQEKLRAGALLIDVRTPSNANWTKYRAPRACRWPSWPGAGKACPKTGPSSAFARAAAAASKPPSFWPRRASRSTTWPEEFRPGRPRGCRWRRGICSA